MVFQFLYLEDSSWELADSSVLYWENAKISSHSSIHANPYQLF